MAGACTLPTMARTLAAMLALHLRDKYLDQLFVAPKHQGKGLGRRLLAFTRQQLPDEISASLRARERKGLALVRA